MTDDWKMPVSMGSRVLFLTPDELILIDWVLCPASQFIPGLDLDIAVEIWHDLRKQVWYHLVRITSETPYDGDINAKEHILDIDESGAKALFAVVPPTFRWPPPPTVNMCPDTGYNLKSKLYLFITGDHVPEHVESDDQSNVKPKSIPGDE